MNFLTIRANKTKKREFNQQIKYVRKFPVFLILMAHFHFLFCFAEEQILLNDLHNDSLIDSKQLYEIASLGAPTSGPLVEGIVGAIHKGCRHRFHCYSSSPTHGFIGPQNILKPLEIKDQPGIFPAPIIGPASLTFTFSFQDPVASLTPVIVRPDGTVLKGLPMSANESPQTVVIPSPAQTGIYTLFVLAHHLSAPNTQVAINTTISTQPHQNQTIYLRLFNPTQMKDVELVSGEFLYTPLH